MQYEIRHAIPGRMRVRLPGLKAAGDVVSGYSRLLERRFPSEPPTIAMRWNAGCASLVIEYDPAEHNLPSILLEIVERTPVAEWRALCAKEERVQAAGEPGDWTRALAAQGSKLPSAIVSVTLAIWGGPVGLVVNVPLLIFNGLPIWNTAWRVLRDERRLNVDFLDGLAVFLALTQGDLVATSVMILLIRLGNWIRERTARKSKRAISELLDYQGRTAWVLRGEHVVRIAVKELTPGDTVVVYPGELIPVDGKVLRGSAAVDQKTITGESLPVVRSNGHPVYAGTVVREGKLAVCAERVGSETAAAQIVRLVEGAPVGETRMQNYAEKFADRLVAPQLGLGFGLFCLTGDLNRFLSMTIIDYGTGIRVAAPTAVLASMTHAARQGIVIRSGSQMEKLSMIDTVVFDKTGTLTTGSPEVMEVRSYAQRHFSADQILGLAAAAEARVEHPVGRAVVAKAQQRNIEIPPRSKSHYEIGMGVSAQINGFFVHVGSRAFLRRNGISANGISKDLAHASNAGVSSLLVSVDDSVVGHITYADKIRPESADVVRALYRHGRAKRTVMLTGDNSMVARSVAGQLGIQQFVAETMPAEKADIIRELQRDGSAVAMVGDGINDSAALAYADVGIAMKNGADVARETADVVLMEDNLWKLVQAIDIAKNSMGLIRQNYALIAALNTVALILAIPTGIVNPGLTALISNGSAILGTLNSIRPILQY